MKTREKIYKAAEETILCPAKQVLTLGSTSFDEKTKERTRQNGMHKAGKE